MDSSISLINDRITELFKDLIDMSDIPATAPQSNKDSNFRTRALAAYALYKEIDVDPSVAAEAIVDGGQDYGIDAIVLFAGTNTLYIVQSKFHSKENIGTDKGDVLKLLEGVDLLLNEKLEKANPKLQAKLEEIGTALSGTTKVRIIIATTGLQVAGESQEPIDRFLGEKNSYGEQPWLFYDCFFNNTFKEFVASDRAPQQIDLEVPLIEWGLLKTPYRAFYGLISAQVLGEWYRDHGKDVVSANIRNYLGAETEVNKKITDTLLTNPAQFIYLNNGLTAICSSIDKTNKFAENRQAGEFICKNIKIINGAQTFGCIGRVFRTNSDILKDAWVMIKIVSVGSTDETLRHKVTVATNSQNQIELADFASMDTVQIKIEKELLRDFGRKYIRLRTEGSDIDITRDITMPEAASALLCFEDDVKLAINHKREINDIWSDLRSTPYITVFNNQTPSLKVLNLVDALKTFRGFIKAKGLKRGREQTFSKSGDHFLLHMILQDLPDRRAQILKKPAEFKVFLDQNFSAICEKVYNEVWTYLQTEQRYKNVQLNRFLISPEHMVVLKQEILAKR